VTRRCALGLLYAVAAAIKPGLKYKVLTSRHQQLREHHKINFSPYIYQVEFNNFIRAKAVVLGLLNYKRRVKGVTIA
jgi:hypothetical protein